MPKFLNTTHKAVLPLGVLLCSALVYALLVFTKSAPKVEKPAERGVLVTARTLEKGSSDVVVRGNGTVQALQEVSIGAEVLGQVSWVSSNLIHGGFAKKNDELFRIESKDYELRVQAAQAEVARAEQELEVVKANAAIAEEEWSFVQKLNKSEDEKSVSRSALQMFKPQLKTAKAALASAQASLTQAELNLERTSVRAPFNSFVVEKNVELGQYVTAGQQAVKLLGTDAVEVFVPITASESRWLRRAMERNRSDSLSALVELLVDEDTIAWNGFVDRVLAEVDTRGRMHRAVVRVANPYFESGTEKKHVMPLSVGMFAGIKIDAGELENVFKIPRSALRSDRTVWLVDENNRLQIREVSIARGDTDYVYVGEGLKDGERLIVSPLSGAVEGLLLRVTLEDSAGVSL